MDNLSAGKKHMISDMCDSWLMTIIEIAGGVGNIPSEKLSELKKTYNACIEAYYDYLNRTNFTDNEFWEIWKIKRPDFYDFNSFAMYNPNKQKAKELIIKAKSLF